MKTIALPSGQRIPTLGMGTWRMGESAHQRQNEVAALRHGLDLGITLIDTAEIYGEGGAEIVIAEAILSLYLVLRDDSGKSRGSSIPVRAAKKLKSALMPS